MRVERGVRALVRLEPLLARCTEDIPDHREHRCEELVPRRVADHLVEADVLFHICLAGRDLALLRREDLAQLGDLRVADARRSQRRERRFDQAAKLDDVGNAVAARDQAVERSNEIVGRDLTDEGAATGPRLDDAEELERPQRLTHRSPRDLELLRERALGRELISRPELALFQERFDLFDDALVEPAAPDRLDDGQFKTSPIFGLVRWSDQNGKRLRRFRRSVKGFVVSPGEAARVAVSGAPMRALIFDLDGTLVDTVYGHVFAWQRALAEAGLPIDGWKVHRRIGMSGGLFTRAVAREVGRALSDEEAARIQKRHGELFRELLPERRPLPGAVELLRHLRDSGITHGIATSGRRPEIDLSLTALGIPTETVVVERGDVLRAKPEPDLFLKCQQRLGVPPDECYVVGDAVWDLLGARRAKMLSVGLLSGGYGWDELISAGAFRVYRDPADLHRSLDELGIS
jgi:HAD superfamily hydrolase (TIGR01509 family)